MPNRFCPSLLPSSMDSVSSYSPDLKSQAMIGTHFSKLNQQENERFFSYARSCSSPEERKHPQSYWMQTNLSRRSRKC